MRVEELYMHICTTSAHREGKWLGSCFLCFCSTGTHFVLIGVQSVHEVSSIVNFLALTFSHSVSPSKTDMDNENREEEHHYSKLCSSLLVSAKRGVFIVRQSHKFQSPDQKKTNDQRPHPIAPGRTNTSL